MFPHTWAKGGVHFFGLKCFRRSNCFIPIRDPNSYKTMQIFFANFVRIHTNKFIQLLYKWNEQRKIRKSKKMEVPPLAPGITESVDKCTKNIEIQSQKRQYEIANMHNFVPNNSSHHPQKRIIRFHSSASEVAAKTKLMGHPVSSCHVPVVRSCFILFHTLKSS